MTRRAGHSLDAAAPRPALVPVPHRTRRIVIIGGGFAGLAVALALRRYDARCQVTVLERLKTPPGNRFGITLAPNGLEALAALGLLPRVLAEGRRLDAFEVVAAGGGRRTARFDFACLSARVPYAVGILPNRLVEILRDAVGDAARLLVDQRVTGVRAPGRHSPYEVVTRSAAGEHTFPADVVVGADGVRSAIRPYVTSGHVELDVDEAYQVVLGGAVEGLRSVQQHVGPGRLLGMVPVARDRTFIFWYCRRSQAQAIREQSLDRFKQTLVRHVPALEPALTAVTSWSEVYPSTITLTRSPTWFAGGLVLIGDSVHATTPSLAQGANMALVDAIGLGSRLAAWSHDASPDGLPRHLRAFVAERRAQVRAQHWLGRLLVGSNRLGSPLVTRVKLASLDLLSRWPPIRRAVLETLTGLRP